MGSAPTRQRKPFVPPRLTRYGMIEKITMISGTVNGAGDFYEINGTGFGMTYR